jgi:hypothetical protein
MCLAERMPLKRSRDLDVVAIVGLYKVGADEQQDDLCSFEMLVDRTGPVIAGADISIVPAGNDFLTLEEREMALELIAQLLVTVCVRKESSMGSGVALVIGRRTRRCWSVSISKRRSGCGVSATTWTSRSLTFRLPIASALRKHRSVRSVKTGIEGAEGLVLRYGAFYGPGTGVSADPEALLTKAIRKRRLPIIGGGGGVWSFVHIEDAASATVAAVDNGGPGIYNVVDDEPAPVREWLPFLAEQLGAKKPMRVPRFVVRLLAGEAAVMQMTEVRGGSNAKAKRVLGWQPRWSSWRVGFAKGLGE